MTIGDRDGSGVIEPKADGAPEAGAAPPREPILRSPWPPVALGASFMALYGLQTLAGPVDDIQTRFGFSPADLVAGRWGGLVTALFIHGGWAHVFLNSLGTLAFGAPIARVLGKGMAGAGAFFCFFLICGVLSSLGFAAFHWDQSYLLMGASGGVSGLMAAASRLIERRDQLAPLTSRNVVIMGLAFVALNLAIGFVGLGGVTGGAPIAWEAHIAGYVAGLLLIGPTLRLLRR